jgi:NAD(P)-dependent dehydrogenase (short-subunit alcohol dehydrogenase family)
VKEYGRIDIMVNNAGISVEAGDHGIKPVWEYDEDAFQKTLDVNTTDVFLGTKYATKQMVGQEPGAGGHRGWVIKMASMLALRGGAGFGKLIVSACSQGFWLLGVVSGEEKGTWVTNDTNSRLRNLQARYPWSHKMRRARRCALPNSCQRHLPRVGGYSVRLGTAGPRGSRDEEGYR